jgi:hypothetical protein
MSHSFAALIRECLCRYRSSQRALADGIHVNPGYVARMLAELEESIDLDPGIVSKILSGEDLPSGQDVRIKHVINMIRWLRDQQYAGRKEVVELLEAAGMPQLNPRDPEQARLQEQLNREFPCTHRLPSPHRRFGELLCKFLSRKRGVSLYKLGDECESIGGPGVVVEIF